MISTKKGRILFKSLMPLQWVECLLVNLFVSSSNDIETWKYSKNWPVLVSTWRNRFTNFRTNHLMNLNEGEPTCCMRIWRSIPTKMMPFPIRYNTSSTLYHGYKCKKIVRLVKKKKKLCYHIKGWSLVKICFMVHEN